MNSSKSVAHIAYLLTTRKWARVSEADVVFLVDLIREAKPLIKKLENKQAKKWLEKVRE